MNEISVQKFLEDTGIDRATFNQGMDLGIIPLTTSGKIDFTDRWYGLQERIQNSPGDQRFIEKINIVRDQIERQITGSSYRSPSTRDEHVPSHPGGTDFGEFVSENGRKAFQKNLSNIHIKGQTLSSPSGDTWWEREGFISEEGALAFKRAMERGVVRIFNKQTRDQRRTESRR